MHSKYLIELLTPRQSDEDFEAVLETMAERYCRIIEQGYVVSVPDNPMGILRFQITEVVSELALPAPPGQLLVHLNTFHTKENFDEKLEEAARMGMSNLLLVSGDGAERLSKLDPQQLGSRSNTVTSVELLEYVHRRYPDVFECGVTFNSYEPEDHEFEKLRHKIDAGAAFVATQPIMGPDRQVDALRQFGLPVYVGAWMSRNLSLLSECVGYELAEGGAYDPEENLRGLTAAYPEFGFYISMLGFKKQFPRLREMLPQNGCPAEHELTACCG